MNNQTPTILFSNPLIFVAVLAWSLTSCGSLKGPDSPRAEVPFPTIQSDPPSVPLKKSRVFVYPAAGTEVPGLGTMWKRTGAVYTLGGSTFSPDGSGFFYHDLVAGDYAMVLIGGAVSPLHFSLLPGETRYVRVATSSAGFTLFDVTPAIAELQLGNRTGRKAEAASSGVGGDL